jgi:CBS domain-containing membrane protein
MAATDTEHAPAAGTVLGVVAHNFSFCLVFFLATGVVFLSVTHVILRSRLRDLM